MQVLDKRYNFRGKVLTDGHLSIPVEIAEYTGQEFEVLMTPIDDVNSHVSLYLEGQLKRDGKIEDLNLGSAQIEDAVKMAFDTTNIDLILESIRK